MKKNDIVTVHITDISFDGHGIGRADDGMVVFVKHALVGEILKVHILKVLKNTAYGKIHEFIKISDDRCEPVCAVFRKCGGCAYMHTNYENELVIKKDMVRNALSSVGGIDFSVNDTIGVTEYSYRNKMLVPLFKAKDGKLCAGFYRRNSHEVIPMENCCISDIDFNAIIKKVIEFAEKYNVEPYNEEKHTGVIRHIFIRKGYHSREIMAGIVTNGKSLPHKDEFISYLLEANLNIVSIIQNVNDKKTNVILGDKTIILYGKAYIEDTMLGSGFKISCEAFYQVNTKMAEILYETAISNLDEEDETVFDLYSGAGTISLALSKKAKKVYGIEYCEPAHKNALENKNINNVENVEFICGKSEEEIFTLLNKGIKPDAVVLDPPRSGCHKSLIDALYDVEPKKIIYISCNPSTLARDIKPLLEKYKLKSVQPVDLFPKTHHVECCLLLCRT